MTRTHITTAPRKFGAGLIDEEPPVQRGYAPPPPAPPADLSSDSGPDPKVPPEHGAIEWRVAGVVEGYSTTAVFKCRPENVREAVRKLSARGLERPALFAPDGTPLCPKHMEPLRTREKQGDAWMSHAIKDSHGEVHYCKGRPGKDSPGWMVPAGEGGGS